MSAQAVHLTSKLIETRDFMRRLKGDAYLEWVDPAREIIRGLAKESGQPIAEVALSVAKRMDAAGHDPSIIFCALCEEVVA